MTSNPLHQPGTKLVCVDPNSALEGGQVYTLWEYIPSSSPAEYGFVQIEEVIGQFRSNRFRPAGVGEIATAQAFAEAGAADDPLRGAPLARLSAPDTNPKTRFGLAKPPMALIPGTARVLLSQAFADGVAKYGPANWRESPVSASTYVNAAERHLTSWYDGEAVASDSGVHHLAHAAACLLILLDAEANGTMNDDRPPPGKTAELIKALTKPTP